jgi:hypothetical protein
MWLVGRPGRGAQARQTSTPTSRAGERCVAWSSTVLLSPASACAQQAVAFSRQLFQRLSDSDCYSSSNPRRRATATRTRRAARPGARRSASRRKRGVPSRVAALAVWATLLLPPYRLLLMMTVSLEVAMAAAVLSTAERQGVGAGCVLRRNSASHAHSVFR